jgi:hypothetical protein
VVAIDDSIFSLERNTNRGMIAYSPKAVLPRESTVEEDNERDDVDWLGVVLGDLENNFGNFRLELFGEYPWSCSDSEGPSEMGRLKLEDLDCLELCELSFAMSIGGRRNKRWTLSCYLHTYLDLICM